MGKASFLGQHFHEFEWNKEQQKVLIKMNRFQVAIKECQVFSKA